MKSVFFVPVFNQARELPRVLEELAAVSVPADTVLLVNNGSSDGSETLVRTAGYPYLDLPQNLGVGHGHMRAIEWALERGYDVVGAMAGNAKMLPSEMHRVLTPIVEGRAEMVHGSRYLPGGRSPNLPAFRQAAIPMVNAAVWAITGRRLTDATCGYFAYRLDIIRNAEFDWQAAWLNTYGLEYYLYAKVLLDRRYTSIEVPITMRYPSSGTYSKIRAGRDWYAMLRPWLVARWDGKGFRTGPVPARGFSEAPRERPRPVARGI
jgi:glycosyltransferase involved in cell wall biosynthesis